MAPRGSRPNETGRATEDRRSCGSDLASVERKLARFRNLMTSYRMDETNTQRKPSPQREASATETATSAGGADTSARTSDTGAHTLRRASSSSIQRHSYQRHQASPSSIVGGVADHASQAQRFKAEFDAKSSLVASLQSQISKLQGQLHLQEAQEDEGRASFQRQVQQLEERLAATTEQLHRLETERWEVLEAVSTVAASTVQLDREQRDLERARLALAERQREAEASIQAPVAPDRLGPEDVAGLVTHYSELDIALNRTDTAMRRRALLLAGHDPDAGLAAVGVGHEGGGSGGRGGDEVDLPCLSYLQGVRDALSTSRSYIASGTKAADRHAAQLSAAAVARQLQQQAGGLARALVLLASEAEADAARMALVEAQAREREAQLVTALAENRRLATAGARPSTEEVEVLAQELKKQRQENEVLQSRLRSMRKKLKVAFEDMATQNKELRDKLAEAETELSENDVHLREEAKRLKTELTEARERVLGQQRRESELDTELHKARQLAAALAERAERLQTEMESARPRADELRAEVEAIGARAGQAERRAAELEVELRAERQGTAQLVTKHESQLAGLRSEVRCQLQMVVDAYTQELKALQGQLASMDRVQKEAAAAAAGLRGAGSSAGAAPAAAALSGGGAAAAAAASEAASRAETWRKAFEEVQELAESLKGQLDATEGENARLQAQLQRLAAAAVVSALVPSVPSDVSNLPSRQPSPPSSFAASAAAAAAPPPPPPRAATCGGSSVNFREEALQLLHKAAAAAAAADAAQAPAKASSTAGVTVRASTTASQGSRSRLSSLTQLTESEMRPTESESDPGEQMPARTRGTADCGDAKARRRRVDRPQSRPRLRSVGVETDQAEHDLSRRGAGPRHSVSSVGEVASLAASSTAGTRGSAPRPVDAAAVTDQPQMRQQAAQTDPFNDQRPQPAADDARPANRLVIVVRQEPTPAKARAIVDPTDSDSGFVSNTASSPYSASPESLRGSRRRDGDGSRHQRGSSGRSRSMSRGRSGGGEGSGLQRGSRGGASGQSGGGASSVIQPYGRIADGLSGGGGGILGSAHLGGLISGDSWRSVGVGTEATGDAGGSELPARGPSSGSGGSGSLATVDGGLDTGVLNQHVASLQEQLAALTHQSSIITSQVIEMRQRQEAQQLEQERRSPPPSSRGGLDSYRSSPTRVGFRPSETPGSEPHSADRPRLGTGPGLSELQPRGTPVTSPTPMPSRATTGFEGTAGGAAPPLSPGLSYPASPTWLPEHHQHSEAYQRLLQGSGFYTGEGEVAASRPRSSNGLIEGPGRPASPLRVASPTPQQQPRRASTLITRTLYDGPDADDAGAAGAGAGIPDSRREGGLRREASFAEHRTHGQQPPEPFSHYHRERQPPYPPLQQQQPARYAAAEAASEASSFLQMGSPVFQGSELRHSYTQGYQSHSHQLDDGSEVSFRGDLPPSQAAPPQPSAQQQPQLRLQPQWPGQEQEGEGGDALADELAALRSKYAQLQARFEVQELRHREGQEAARRQNPGAS